MASDAADRLYRVNQELGQPFPTFSDDDVIQFFVAEAIMARGLKHQGDRKKQAEREAWKRRPVGSGTPPRSM